MISTHPLLVSRLKLEHLTWNEKFLSVFWNDIISTHPPDEKFSSLVWNENISLQTRSSHFKRDKRTSHWGEGVFTPHPPTRNSRLSLEMRKSHFKREVLVYLLKLDNLSPHPWRELLVSRLKWEHLISAEKFSFLIYKTCSMYFFSLGDQVGRVC